MRGKTSQVVALFLFYDLIGIGNGDGPVGFFLIGFISTAAVVTAAANSEILVAGKGGNFSLAYLIHHFIGPDIVTHKVAKAIYRIGLLCIHGGE